MAFGEWTKDEDASVAKVTPAMGDEGESLLRWTPPRWTLSRWLGGVLKDYQEEDEEILPPLPNMTLLRLLGGKFWDPLVGLGPFSSSSSSSSKSEAWSDPWMPPGLNWIVLFSSFSKYFISFIDWFLFPFVAMSKKISLKKLAQLVEKSKVATPSTKGVVIWEKRSRDEVPDISPNKKGKIVDD